MQTKLTLRLDARLIENAKSYAAARGRSVSQLVADYFAALGARPEAPTDAAHTSYAPITASLRGALVAGSGAGTDAAPDERDYGDYLARKYLEDRAP